MSPLFPPSDSQKFKLERAEARIAQLEQERDYLRIKNTQLQKKLDAVVEAIGGPNAVIRIEDDEWEDD